MVKLASVFGAARRSSSSFILAVSNLGGFALPLLRGIFLARLLSPTEFGLAISITVVSSIADVISDLGVSQMALRNGTEANLGTLHAISVVRGLLIGVVIALCGPLLAGIFHAPGTAGAYVVVGVASFLRGFVNLDVKVRMRSYDYLPDMLTNIGGHLASTVATIAIAYAVRDHRAMVGGLVAYSLVYVLVSHVMASRPWRLAWDRAVVRESVAYGRPLLVSGIASVVTNMGDRALTGAKISLDQLASYSVLATSAFMPRTAISGFLSSLFVPHLVNAKTTAERRRFSDLWIVSLSILGTVFALGYIAFGHAVIAFVFGAKYQVDQTLIDLIALLACTRYLGGLPLAPGLASGQTSLITVAALASTLGLAMGALLLLREPTLASLIAGMALGETVALLWVARRCLQRVPSTAAVTWSAILVPLIGLCGICAVLEVRGNGEALRFGLCGLGLVLELLFVRVLLRLSGADLGALGAALAPKRAYAR